MEAWTRFVVRRRRRVLLAWLLLAIAGGLAATNLDHVLSNNFGVPGSEAERGADLLREQSGVSLDGGFVLVFEPAARGPKAGVPELAAAGRGAAAALPDARAGGVRIAREGVRWMVIDTPLEGDEASDQTDGVRAALPELEGWSTYVTGPAAIAHDIEPVFNDDLARSESIALPLILVILAFTLGTIVSATIPLLFAAATVTTSLGLVWLLAHAIDVTDYVTNIVTLVGLAIAVDYSMLIVLRFREELAKGRGWEAALARTMATAGRSTLLSGLTVAIGLALLGVIDQPFLRSMGLGGLTVPLVSIAASLSLLPALLAVLGERVERGRLLSTAALKRRSQPSAAWRRVATAAIRRPVLCGGVALALLVTLAIPAAGLNLTAGFSGGGGGDARDIGDDTEATGGLRLLQRDVAGGVLTPNYIVAAGAMTGDQRLSLARSLRRDPEVSAQNVRAQASPASAVIAAGLDDAGAQPSQDLVRRIRDRYVPAVGLDGDSAPVTGQPALARDFIDRVAGVFPWLAIAVLIVSFAILIRPFRSLLLPLKALVMNLLSVLAAYGVLVLVFQHGWGEPFGVEQRDEIQTWVPVFLFAIMFGLSMDYEVFLISRVREEHDRGHPTDEAVVRGLARSGRVVSAAAAIMVATFLSFATGRFAGLQMFGVGLAAAIALDATLIRGLLFPATMKLLGERNWWLPAPMRRGG